MTRIRRAVAAINLGLLLAGWSAAPAQPPTSPSVDQHFRIEWQVIRSPKGPRIDGYVYNQARQAAERMRLEIDRLDASAAVVGQSTVWVLGDIPADSRAYFTASVPEAASYRVRVQSFDWASCGSGSM